MIYFDNAATTKPTDVALNSFADFNKENYFNPSAGYSKSFSIFKQINEIKKDFIKFLGGRDDDKFIFTSGATESNNLAILGSALNKKGKYLFSIGEHPSVFNCANELKNRGYNIEFIGLQKNGQIDYEELKLICTSDVCFVSTMLVNNETGAINNIKLIREIIDSKTQNCVFHVDAVQGFGKINFSLKQANVNLCSISAHKIGGIKGIGGLYISKNTKIKNINYGGNQENGLRSGTINGAGIISFFESAKDIFANKEKNFENVSKLNLYLKNNLSELKNAIIVSNEFCSPYILSAIFSGNRGETIMRFLDSKEILVGTGSACSANKIGNRILENMGYSKDEVMGAIRISFNPSNTKDEIDELILNLKLYFDTINT